MQHNCIDLTGKRFGKLVVLKKGAGHRTKGNNYQATWVCQCDCGNIKEITGQRLRTGHTASCGCQIKENKGSRYEDITGRRFNHLTVIRFLSHEERKSPHYNWLCKCDCGNLVHANAAKLKNGTQKSCGCLKEEVKQKIADLNRKYQFTDKRLYGVYKAMLNRCYDERERSFHNYGGRGIEVCPEWQGEHGYDAFSEWALKAGYVVGGKRGVYTLERKDVNGNYEPSNCCWITNKKQQNNRRDNRRITYNGETHTIAEWAEICNRSYSTIYNGVIRYNKNIGDYLND